MLPHDRLLVFLIVASLLTPIDTDTANIRIRIRALATCSSERKRRSFVPSQQAVRDGRCRGVPRRGGPAKYSLVSRLGTGVDVSSSKLPPFTQSASACSALVCMGTRDTTDPDAETNPLRVLGVSGPGLTVSPSLALSFSSKLSSCPLLCK